jgi:hypothetical protein
VSAYVGAAVPAQPVPGRLEFGGSVAISLPEGVTAQVVNDAVYLHGTFDGIDEFLMRGVRLLCSVWAARMRSVLGL